MCLKYGIKRLSKYSSVKVKIVGHCLEVRTFCVCFMVLLLDLRLPIALIQLFTTRLLILFFTKLQQWLMNSDAVTGYFDFKLLGLNFV